MTDIEINKYHTSKIYKISSPQTDKFYIGSTTQKLNIRLQSHISKYKRYLEKKNTYTTSFEVVKFNDAIIELIKDVKCENKKELERIEGQYILEYHDRILNKLVAGRTVKEWRNVNKEKISENAKECYKENKEKLLEYSKDYYQKNICKYRDMRKIYYEKMKSKYEEKFNCDCGGKYTSKNLLHHNKTKKHINFISLQN
jgi:hypothetical protein